MIAINNTIVNKHTTQVHVKPNICKLILDILRNECF